MVLTTKYSSAAPGTDPNAAGNHRKNMMQAVEANLKRLQTDYIDLYWVHIWDQITPVEEDPLLLAAFSNRISRLFSHDATASRAIAAIFLHTAYLCGGIGIASQFSIC